MPGTAPLALLEDENYPKYWRYVWGAAVTGLDPDTSAYSAYTSAFPSGGSAVSLYSATKGHSPHSGVTAVDPTTVIASMQSKVTAVQSAIDALFKDSGAIDIQTRYNDAVSNAIAQYDGIAMQELDPTAEVVGDLKAIGDAYDAHVATPSEVDALVDAIDEASKRHYLRDVARVTAGMFDVRAVMGSQLGFMVANLENQRASEAAEAEARLRAVVLREKGANVTHLVGQTLDAKLQYVVRENQTHSMMVLEMINHQIAQTPILINSMMSLASLQMQQGQYDVGARQDKVHFDLEQQVRDKLWNWEMFSYFQQAVAMHGGAMPLPRAQTPMERIGGAVMSGIGTGLMGGLALGPQAGFAIGIGTTLLSLVTAPWKFG